MANRSSTRDPKKEAFWREKLRNWQDSGLSQAEFCRNEGLNPNSFSSWKVIIPKRDAERATTQRTSGDRGRARQTVAKQLAARRNKPTFVRLDLSEGTNARTVSTRETIDAEQSEPSGREFPAAELIDPRSGCRVRIFNGADRSTLTALVSALATC
jgi:hypothetical protein